MNFTNLQYFLTIAETGSITEAANRLFISQQTLSESLRRLEDELGQPLIRRTRPISLTDAGQCVAKAARDILARRDQLLRELESSSKNAGLVIYTGPGASPPFLPKLMAAFQQLHPSCPVSVQVYDETAIAAGGVCFSIVFAALDRRLAWYPVLQDNFAVLVQPALLDKTFPSRAAELRQGLRDSGDLALLRGLPFVLYAPPPGASDPAARALAMAGIEDGLIRYEQQPHLVTSLCEIGAAAFLAPLSNARFSFGRQIAEGAMELFPLDEKYGSYQLHIGCGKKCAPQSIERQFIRFAQAFLRRPAAP